MATNSTMMKSVIIYLAISLFLYVGGIRVVDSVDPVVSNFVDTDTNRTLSSSLVSAAPDVNEQTGSLSGVLSFIDALRSVRNWVNFILNVMFAVPGLFLGSDFPLIINLLVGIPITIIGIMGLMYFVRSGQ